MWCVRPGVLLGVAVGWKCRNAASSTATRYCIAVGCLPQQSPEVVWVLGCPQHGNCSGLVIGKGGGQRRDVLTSRRALQDNWGWCTSQGRFSSTTELLLSAETRPGLSA